MNGKTRVANVWFARQISRTISAILGPLACRSRRFGL